MRKISFITNIPTPYREVLFYEMNKHFKLKVYYCSKKEKNRVWEIDLRKENYDFEILPGISIKRFYHLNPSIITNLFKDKSDLTIIGGYTYPSAIIAAFTCKIMGKKTYLMIDGKGKTNIKEIRRFILNIFDGFLVANNDGREYIEKFGFQNKRIYKYNLTINVGLTQEKAQLFTKEITLFKRNQGLNEMVFLYVGRICKRKGLDILVQALNIVSKEHKNFTLLIVGNTEDDIFFNEIKSCMKFNFKHVDYVENDLLYKYYCISDFFILPSRIEPWGLVVNEALSCGVPTVVSSEVGAKDLIKDGYNGYIFKNEDVVDLYDKISEIVKLDYFALQQNCIKTMHEYTNEANIKLFSML